jgi:hypothetical protein
MPSDAGQDRRVAHLKKLAALAAGTRDRNRAAIIAAIGELTEAGEKVTQPAVFLVLLRRNQTCCLRTITRHWSWVLREIGEQRADPRELEAA